MDHILIVEDEERLREIIRDYLESHGLCCTTAEDGEAALEALRTGDYDAILLDIMMPHLDGWSVCKEVRKKSGVPILFLTALGGEEDQLRGYALGADDYITKPFSLAVLLAKTRTVIRRNRGTIDTQKLSCGAISVDLGRQCCYVQGEEKRLTTGEYQLLLCFLHNQGQVLSRGQLLDKVWGLDYEGDDRAVDVRIRSLRAALGSAGAQIKTVYKAGYRMETREL